MRTVVGVGGLIVYNCIAHSAKAVIYIYTKTCSAKSFIIFLFFFHCVSYRLNSSESVERAPLTHLWFLFIR